MWFAILGPLLVHDGKTPVDIPKGRQRALLTALLMHTGNPVPTDALAEIVWDGAPPPGAEVTLRSHVLRLRRVLGPRAGTRLVTRHPGYLLQAGEDEVDVLRFRCLCREGRAAARAGAWGRAQALLGEGLDLWRGTALADVPAESLRRDQVQDLEELRLQAEEWRIDAALHLGRHDELIPGLQSLAARHPLRERFHGQLMMALYRCSRQAEALAAYQRARDVLVKELGTEPGPELQGLHQRILSADPVLAVTEQPAEAEPQRVTPRELPPAVPGFTGRSAELQVLTRLLDRPGGQPAGTVVISAIGGTAGVGKTALAVHWAHQVAGRFPDGQLYVNLRGYDPGQPVPATDALAGFLRSLGVPGQDIPPEEDQRAVRYRSLLAGKRMLVVLDNAGSAGQVRPLLPGSPACTVMVTSRDALAGLVARDGATRLDLDVLPSEDAVTLLRTLIGARVDAEPAAAAELAEQCCRLPLALRVAAELAASRPAASLAGLARELADQHTRLDLLEAGGDPLTQVRTVFSWSYRHLDAEAARIFRLLGLHPGPDLEPYAAAALTGATVPQARRALDLLARVHLIQPAAPGRYGMHDLLRGYAYELTSSLDTKEEQRAALIRLFDHYLYTADHGSFLLAPGREPIALARPRPGTVAEQPADYQQAMTWFEAEHRVLLAAVPLAVESGFDRHAWQLPCAMMPFLRARGYYQEWAAVQRMALGAATRLGDIAGQALSSRFLASALTLYGDYDQVFDHCMTSLGLYRQLGNRLGEAKAHQNLGMLAERQRRYADALFHTEQALYLYRALGDKADVVHTLNDVGWCHGLLGDYQQARAVCQEALALNAEVGDRRFEGIIWDSLGYAQHHLGDHGDAAACYKRAVAIFRECGDRYFEATTLSHLGDTRRAVGELPQAREAWEQALAILKDLRHPDADQVRAKLASADAA